MDKTVSACSNCPRSARAPAATMRISSASSPLSWAASGPRASSIARSGRPEATFAVGDQRQQRRLAAHPAGRPQFGERLGPVAAVVGGDADGFTDRRDPAGPCSRRAGVLQRSLGIVVEQSARRDEVAGHRVGGCPVQGAELAPDLWCQLLGLDVGRYRRRRRPAVRAASTSRSGVLRLGAAGTTGTRAGQAATGLGVRRD